MASLEPIPPHLTYDELWMEAPRPDETPTLIAAIAGDAAAHLEGFTAPMAGPANEPVAYIEFRFLAVVKGRSLFEAIRAYPACERPPLP